MTNWKKFRTIKENRWCLQYYP